MKAMVDGDNCALIAQEEKMNSDLSDLKPGDDLWTIRSGWVEVTGIGNLVVCSDGNMYMLDGKVRQSDACPSAFIEPPVCFNPEPKPYRFKKSDRVLVRDYDNVPWRRRYFAGENPDQLRERFGTFADGGDEWSAEGQVRYWKYCKPWKEGDEE